MPEYKAPGVYIEETSRGPKPIQGVSTSTAGFVGGAERGPTNARLVTSFAEFAAIYGANADPSASYLPFAVRGFFENGGRRCYVARVDPVDDNAVIGVDDGAATGLRALAEIDEVSLLCAPDQGNKLGVAVARAMVAQAETLADRFVVLQASRDDRDAASIRSRAPDASSYAGLYHPWLRIPTATPGGAVPVPPGGHVCGIIARNDLERGVHKAPGNVPVVGLSMESSGPLAHIVTASEQDALNALGVNVIRDFRTAGRGVRVYGARTLAAAPEWRYVNVRRLFIYLERSIARGLQWTVFEPNGEPTWAAVTQAVTDFLIGSWRAGAFFGATPDQAFFVKCDRTTMTQDDIDNGRLICLVGVAPIKPAEFEIFRVCWQTAS